MLRVGESFRKSSGAPNLVSELSAANYLWRGAALETKDPENQKLRALKLCRA
jgi:hypothetical protein